MKIRAIIYPNVKGQIVIPQKIRDALSITPDVPLSVSLSGKGIYVHPVEDVVTKADFESSYDQVLKKTQGAWADDNWDETRKKRKKTEISASQSRKEPW